MVDNVFDNSILDQLVFNKSKNTVFIFTINLASDINNVSNRWEYLSVEEKIQANKYYTNHLRDRYVMSHGILRHILSYYTNQFPQNVEFTYNEYGKPFF